MSNEELAKIGKTILKNSIRELKQMLEVELLAESQIIQERTIAPRYPQSSYDWDMMRHKGEEKLLNKEIKNKTWKLEKLEGKEETVRMGWVTEEEIARAKAEPIETFFTERLRKSGTRLVARCPFHAGGNERTGSFFIYTKDNSYHCFSCSAHGDCIDFFMKLNNVDFCQAVKNLTN